MNGPFTFISCKSSESFKLFMSESKLKQNKTLGYIKCKKRNARPTYCWRISFRTKHV